MPLYALQSIYLGSFDGIYWMIDEIARLNAGLVCIKMHASFCLDSAMQTGGSWYFEIQVSNNKSNGYNVTPWNN